MLIPSSPKTRQANQWLLPKRKYKLQQLSPTIHLSKTLTMECMAVLEIHIYALATSWMHIHWKPDSYYTKWRWEGNSGHQIFWSTWNNNSAFLNCWKVFVCNKEDYCFPGFNYWWVYNFIILECWSQELLGSCHF